MIQTIEKPEKKGITNVIKTFKYPYRIIFISITKKKYKLTSATV